MSVSVKAIRSEIALHQRQIKKLEKALATLGGAPAKRAGRKRSATPAAKKKTAVAQPKATKVKKTIRAATSPQAGDGQQVPPANDGENNG